MDAFIHSLVHDVGWLTLLLVFALSIAVLGYSADRLVDLAVTLSVRTGMPRVIIGATIVSLGTTMPEAAVSVYAAIKGQPDLALGNAVGSIICDTGLILGLACILMPLPIDRRIVNRQGWIQVAAGLLLVLCCIPASDPFGVFDAGGGGIMPQRMGWLFIALLIAYMAWSMTMVRDAENVVPGDQEKEEGDAPSAQPVWLTIILMFVSCLFLVASAMVLIGATKEGAERLDIPEGIIAATLVAFGTSLPELVTAMTAVRKKKGEIAIGNVIGADILNVLFVAGASASVTQKGLEAGPYFFRLQFPVMLLVLFVFRFGIATARKGKLARYIGFLLLAIYISYLILNVTVDKS
jgi:cation:H+ antiporter